MKVVYFSMPYIGHINPNIPLFKELQRMQIELYIFGDEEYLSKLIGNKGVTYIKLPEYVLEYSKIHNVDSVDSKDCAEEYFSMIYNESVLKEKAFRENSLQTCFYNDYISLIKSIDLDCIMYDSYAFYMKKIINDANIKYVDINCAMTVLENYYVSDSWKEYLTDIVLNEVQNAPTVEQICMIKRHMQRFNQRFSAAKHRNNIKINYFCYHCDLLQFKDEPSYEYPYYLGYHLDSSLHINKDHSIYVSRGTMSDAFGILMLKRTLECIDGIDCTCHVSVGNNSELLQQLNQQGYCDNIHLYLYVNQIEYLSKADIFITHGGISGVREAILCSTPMILCPTNYLDYLLAKELEQNGAGILIKNRPLHRNDIVEAIDYMSKNIEKYQAGIVRIAEQLTDTWNQKGIHQIIDLIYR